MSPGRLDFQRDFALSVKIKNIKFRKEFRAVAPWLNPDLPPYPVGSGYFSGFDKLFFHIILP